MEECPQCGMFRDPDSGGCFNCGYQGVTYEPYDPELRGRLLDYYEEEDDEDDDDY